MIDYSYVETQKRFIILIPWAILKILNWIIYCFLLFFKMKCLFTHKVTHKNQSIFILRNFVTSQRNIHFSMTFKALKVKLQNSMTYQVFCNPGMHWIAPQTFCRVINNNCTIIENMLYFTSTEIEWLWHDAIGSIALSMHFAFTYIIK